MSKPAFTPGPWLAEPPDDFGDYAICPGYERLAVAAAVTNLRPAGEVKANANLIAAGPDMYEALRALDKEWSAHYPDGTETVEYETAGIVVRIHPDTIKIWKAVRAALAKAEGR